MNLKTLISNNKKAFIASLVFHILLISVYFFYFYSSHKKNQEKIAVPMKYLCCCVMQDCPMNKNKKLEEPKEIVKPKQNSEKKIVEKKIIKESAIKESVTEKPSPKKEIIEEKIAQIKPTEVNPPQAQPVKEPFVEKQAHEVVKKVEIATPKQTQKEQEEEFATTNFSSIRDMATKNLIYPNRAQKMGWGGTTEIKIVIDTNGKLLEATINKSSGKEILDNSALESVLALKDEILPKPKRVSTLILPISFSIKK